MASIGATLRKLVPLLRRDKRDFVLERMHKASVCAEIGVYKGDFSEKIIEIVGPKRLHLIDPWTYEEDETYGMSLYGGQAGVNQNYMDAIYGQVQKRFKRQIDAGVVKIHRASSVEACANFPDEYFDWIYVDGNHLYEFVKQDLNSYYSKVKGGGYIAGDDYHTVGWWQGGVKRAVDEFISQRRCERILIESNQFILRKP